MLILRIVRRIDAALHDPFINWSVTLVCGFVFGYVVGHC